jgi:hypothetical protein
MCCIKYTLEEVMNLSQDRIEYEVNIMQANRKYTDILAIPAGIHIKYKCK